MNQFDIDWLGPYGKGAPKSVSQIIQPTIPPRIANRISTYDPVRKAAPIPMQTSVARRKTSVRSAGGARNERHANATVIVSIIKSRSPNFGVSGRDPFLEFIGVPRKHQLVLIAISQSSLLSSQLSGFPAAFRFSLSDASILQQAASAVTHVASSQPVERTKLGSQHQRPQCFDWLRQCTRLWNAADGWIELGPLGDGKLAAMVEAGCC